jgi:hypothetical protein
MSLIKCPECGKQISDKSDLCPNCGLPSKYYLSNKPYNEKDITTHGNEALNDFNAKEFKNALISFDADYQILFTPDRYVEKSRISAFSSLYHQYYELLKNQLVLQYIKNHAIELQIDDMVK